MSFGFDFWVLLCFFGVLFCLWCFWFFGVCCFVVLFIFCGFFCFVFFGMVGFFLGGGCLGVVFVGFFVCFLCSFFVLSCLGVFLCLLVFVCARLVCGVVVH